MIYGFSGTTRGMTVNQKFTVEDLLKLCTVFHHGDCIGSDEQAHDLARTRGAYIIVHPPLDAKKRAHVKDYDVMLPAYEFLTRNKHIVRDSPGGLIATPRQFREVLRSGTWMTIRYAVSFGIRVSIVYPDGSVEVREPVKNRTRTPAGNDR